jgi:hypothetical protein
MLERRAPRRGSRIPLRPNSARPSHLIFIGIIVLAVLVSVQAVAQIAASSDPSYASIGLSKTSSGLPIATEMAPADNKPATDLSYNFNVKAPAGGVGKGAVSPNPGDLLNYTITYSPKHNGIVATVKDDTAKTSSSLSYKLPGPFKAPTPGMFLLGVGASLGIDGANYTVKDIYVYGSEGKTTILTSAPNPIYNSTMFFSGDVQGFNTTTGALTLVPPCCAFTYGFALFPYRYTGGDLTLTMLANYTVGSSPTSDGLEEYLFVTSDLVAQTGSGAIETQPASSGFVPTTVTSGQYSAEGVVGVPDDAGSYFVIQWDPYYSGSQFNVYEPYTSGTYVSSFVAAPASVDLGSQTTLFVNFSASTHDLKFRYSSLPPGCKSANKDKLECTPSGSGTYVVQVTVTGSDGSSNVANATLVVQAPITAPTGVRIDTPSMSVASSSSKLVVLLVRE